MGIFNPYKHTHDIPFTLDIEDDTVDDGVLKAQPYNTPRGLTGAAQRIDLSKRNNQPIRKTSLAWQHAAFDYMDRVGELQSVALLIAHLVSRAMLFAAVVRDPSSIPVAAEELLLHNNREKEPDLDFACEIAIEALAELFAEGQSTMLDRLALNLFVVGECYLLKMSNWTVASIDEIVRGDPNRLRRSRVLDDGTGAAGGIPIPRNSYLARLWRPHPRWYNDPFSSVLGVLDQLEMVVLFDQQMRHIARQRMGAGIITIPNNFSSSTEKSIYEALAEATQSPIEDESSAATVTPLLFLKPPNTAGVVGDDIQYTEIGRKIDKELIEASSNSIGRVITGLDIPTDVVTGLSGIRYSNALVTSDALVKSHLEPLIILICDLITNAYLKPILRKNKIPARIANQIVTWYNPSNIVTRPDKSTAANEGLDRNVISGKAWRNARGFTELDKPSGQEILQRIAVTRSRATLAPNEVDEILKTIDPEVFQNIPTPPPGQLVRPTPAPAEDTTGKNPTKPSSSGGTIPQGGTMPPR